MKTMLDVINASSGVNSASPDKFPDRVLTGTFDAGFKTALLAKDIRLYLENAAPPVRHAPSAPPSPASGPTATGPCPEATSPASSSSFRVAAARID